jgi:hypothetical protein
MTCKTTNAISFGNPGKNGASSYIYVAYADDVVAGTPDVVTNFTYGIPQSTTKWMAVKNSNLQLTNPVESDFQDLWVQVAGVGISPDTNIYNTDGTLDGDRTVDADGYSLSFTNLAALSINGLLYPIVDGASGQFLATDGSGNIVFVDPTNIYTSDGTLLSNRIIDGDGYSLSIGNSTMPQLNINTSDEFNVATANLVNIVVSEVDGLYQISSDYVNQLGKYGSLTFTTDAAIGTRNTDNSIHARVFSNNGVLYLDVTDHIEIYQGTTMIYKLPTTTPTTGQVLTALDNAGTLGWA